MPREKIVTASNVADAIESANRPFVTTGDAAEHLDVTEQAIRNNEEELTGSEILDNGKVGRARVYWLAESDTPEPVTEEPGEPIEREPEHEPVETDEAERESVLSRLFTGMPWFGSPVEDWLLASLTLYLGLIIGLSAGLAVTHPALGVATTAVLLVLVLGFTLSLSWALYYYGFATNPATMERDNA